jgi:AraC-like DNA-binding protein
LSIAVFLPPQLLAHVRHVFHSETDFFVASSWEEVEALIRREPLDVLILDPSADGVVNVDAVAGILAMFPSLPVVGYVMLNPTSFGAIAQLSRRGLTHVVLHRFGDSRERLQQTISRVQTHPPSQRIVNMIAPSLRRVPLALTRAVADMFEKPHRYSSVLDLAMMAQLPPVSVYRYLETASITSPKKLLIAAKMSRGLTYLRDPGYSVAEVSTKLGYSHPRIFSAHALEVFNETPSRLRRRVSEEDAVATLLRWISVSTMPLKGSMSILGHQ